MYSIQYSKEARKALKAMPRNTAQLILDKIAILAADPFASNNNVKKLTSHPGFRLRVGEWRVAYTVANYVLVITVIRIAARGEVYR
ncbi:type II toxin-antitoxin system RelE/ParE family toxin [Geomonas sp. Red32]|uniref:type II toxin-antitoxin system RelE family toxin n=1 Tax=Geomonas sp. Red32 TaxID=2912856 RepID=UPI00202CA8C3|nr:type II toxin-antitoxin system RelE/ParE family toxin [Geomonas sp. Red32]MCM0081279.1 type II toxin-antitoxin system RelE/ParE family toxin [Geomonas sp. Red32]